MIRFMGQEQDQPRNTRTARNPEPHVYPEAHEGLEVFNHLAFGFSSCSSSARMFKVKENIRGEVKFLLNPNKC